MTLSVWDPLEVTLIFTFSPSLLLVFSTLLCPFRNRELDVHILDGEHAWVDRMHCMPSALERACVLAADSNCVHARSNCL